MKIQREELVTDVASVSIFEKLVVFLLFQSLLSPLSTDQFQTLTGVYARNNCSLQVA